MRRLLTAIFGVATGSVVFAFAGYWTIELASNNQFDRSLEAEMTVVFVIGPIGAALGFIGGLLLGGKRRGPTV